MKKSQFKERELDLYDLFWRLLEQWKGILLVALILSVLLSSAMLLKNQRASKKIVEADPEILNVLSLYADYMDKRDQYNSNFFNSVDLNNCMTVTCLYEYNSALIPDRNDNFHDETTLGLLNNLYNIILSDDTFRTEMINELKNYWPEIDSKTLGNIMTSYSAHTVAYGPGVITINMVIPKDKDPEELQAVLTKSVYAYHDRISANVTQENTIRFVSFAFKQTDYTSELNARNSRYNLVSSGISQYKNAYNNLEKDDQNIVDKAKEKCGSTSDPSVYEEYLTKGVNKSDVSKKSLLIKYGILGFGGGIMLYIIAYVILIIIVKRVRVDDDLENATGLRNFGGVYEYPYKGFFKTFLHSRKLYAYRTKRSQNISRISDDIKAKLSFSGKDAFTLIMVGSPSERAQAMINEQLGIMKESNFTVETLGIDSGFGLIEDSVIAGLGSVIIQLFGDKTKWNELAALYSKLNEYNVDIVGSQFIDA